MADHRVQRRGPYRRLRPVAVRDFLAGLRVGAAFAAVILTVVLLAVGLLMFAHIIGT